MLVSAKSTRTKIIIKINTVNIVYVNTKLIYF